MSTALSFFRPNVIGELLPLYKTVETKVDAEKSEFWNIQGSYMPDKALCDRISDAAGISYTENCGVKTARVQEAFHGYYELIYIGYAQGEVTEPDGTKRLSSVCEYEYNVRFRAEEDFLKDEMKSKNEQKYDTPLKQKLYVLSLLKAARQRANTGARRRVIHELTGMKTGFKNLFNKNDPDTATVTFKFKKIVANPENEKVIEAGLSSIFGAKTALYGPGPGTALPEPTATIERKITGDVKPLPTEKPVNSNVPGDFSDISFDDIIEPQTENLTREIKALIGNKYVTDKVKQQITTELLKKPSDALLAEIKAKLEKVITINFLVANKKNTLLLPQTIIEMNKLLDRLSRKEDVSYEEAVDLKTRVEAELDRGGLY